MEREGKAATYKYQGYIKGTDNNWGRKEEGN